MSSVVSRFKTTVLAAGRTATGIEIPEEVVESLNAGKKPAVKVTIRGHTYPSTVARRGERYLVGVSARNRERAGVIAGDQVEVEIELDSEPREVAVPAELAAELARDAEAERFFESLTPSQKSWYVLPIEEAKRPETRERRVAKAISMLREGRKR